MAAAASSFPGQRRSLRGGSARSPVARHRQAAPPLDSGGKTAERTDVPPSPSSPRCRWSTLHLVQSPTYQARHEACRLRSRPDPSSVGTFYADWRGSGHDDSWLRCPHYHAGGRMEVCAHCAAACRARVQTRTTRSKMGRPWNLQSNLASSYVAIAALHRHSNSVPVCHISRSSLFDWLAGIVELIIGFVQYPTHLLGIPACYFADDQGAL